MKEPFAVFCIVSFTLIVGLVPTAGKLFSISHIHAESVLLRFGGANIKKSHLFPYKSALFPVSDHFHMQPVPYKTRLFSGKKPVCHFFQNRYYLVMSVDPCLTLILPLAHILTDHADHPHNSHKMIHMLMGYENLSHIHPVKSGMLQLSQQSISSAAIHKQMFFSILNNKTGIVTLCHKCVACTKHCKLHELSSVSL